MKTYEATEMAYRNGYAKGYKDGRGMKKRHDKAENSDGFLHIRAFNPYVHGVVGTEIKLTLKEKIRVLFGKGIALYIGDVFKERGRERWQMKSG